MGSMRIANKKVFGLLWYKSGTQIRKLYLEKARKISMLYGIVRGKRIFFDFCTV